MKSATVKNCLLAMLGSFLLAFGLYHVHSVSNVTEGGQLGLVLLLEHWFSLSPAISALILNLICYFIGWRTLGNQFIPMSILCALSFSLTYGICEQFPPIFPQIGQYPLLAAIVGAMFVGVGTGLCVRSGGAPSGDDALAMSLNKRTGWNIEIFYFISDLTVLLLSLTYIPVRRILWSLLTVVLSSLLVGLIQRLPEKK